MTSQNGSRLHAVTVPQGVEHSTVNLTSPLVAPPSTVATHVTVCEQDDLPCIAGYVITSEIARGGMGRVLEGRELRLDREVAIKVLLPGSDATRFVTEARITARLPHPGIPAVYSLGQLDDSSPYLSMKLIRGRTLYEELRARKQLTQDQPRFLQIFEQIAQAVGFAHAQQIIHRDLKPANVMVGAFGEVQVMDWGLAKDLGTTGQENQVLEANTSVQEGETVAWAGDTPGQQGDKTRSGAVLGTPNYMAPEQARGEPATVQSDVFALGGILYSILTGKTVFGGSSVVETIHQAASGDTSQALANLEEAGAESELADIARQCLSTIPAERPAHGSAVAGLIAAYRHGVAERLKKAETAQAEALVREAEQRSRRRLFQRAVGVVVTVLLAGIIGTSIGLWQAWEAAKSERKANVTAQEEKMNALRAMENEKSAKQTAQQAQKKEAQEKAVALAVREFLQERMLRRVNPWELLNLEHEGTQQRPRVKHDMTVRELLDLAAQEFQPSHIESKFPQQPLVQAEVLETIGETYEGIGDADKALSYVKAAHQLRETHLGMEHPRTMASLTNLAFMHLANSDQKEAMNLASSIVFRLETCLHNSQPISSEGADQQDAAGEAIDAVHRMIERRVDPRRYSLPTVTIGLTEGAMMMMQLVQGLPRAQRVADLYAKRFGQNDRRTMMARLLVGFAHHGMGRVREACDTYEAVLAYAEKHMDRDDFLVAGLQQVMIITYQTLGIRKDEQLRLQQHLANHHERLLGPEHPETLETKLALAASYGKTGNKAEKIALQRKVSDTFNTMLGKEHPRSLQLLLNLGESLENNGQVTEAATMIQEVAGIAQRKLGAHDPVTMNAQHNLASIYRKTGRLKESIPILETLYEDSIKRLGREHHDTLSTMYSLAESYQEAKRFSEAISLLEKLHKTEVTRRGKEHPETLLTQRKLAKTYLEHGNYPQAILLYEQLHAIKEKKEGKEHAETLTAMYQLAEAYRSARQYDKASKLFDHVYGVRSRVLGVEEPDTLDALYCLALTHRNMGKYPMALDQFHRALNIELKKYGLKDSRTLMTQFSIAMTHLDMGKLEQAQQMLEENMKLRKETLGADHSDTLISMHNVGLAMMRRGKADQASRIYEEVRDLKIKKLGLEHPSTITTLSSLGIAYRNSKRLPDAVLIFEQAASLLEKQGYKHENAERVVPFTIRAYEEARQYDKAESWRRKWLPVLKTKSGDQSLIYTEELGGLGLNLIQQKKGIDAEPFLVDAWQKLRKLAPNEWFTYQVQFALGHSKLLQKKYAEAETLLLQGYAGQKERETKIPADRNMLKESPQVLIEYYQAIGKPEEVKRWQAEKVKMTQLVEKK